jgi:YbbR domain-containing protein
MKEKLMNNIVLKIGAVLFAILIWLMVVNTDNAIMSKRISGIPIQFINTEVFTENDKTFQVADGTSTVTVLAYARRLNLGSITASDFKAVVDCNKITDFNGAVKVEVTYTGENNLLERMELVNDTIQITTEDMVTEQREIQVSVEGTPAEGYSVGEVTLNPNTVTIHAPASVMNSIASVGVSVNVDGADSDVSQTVDLIYYDARGKTVLLTDEDQVNVSSPQTAVSVPILKTNQVAIVCSDVRGTDAVAPGYRYVGVECDTVSVNLKGLKSAMSGLNNITIPSEELDVTGAAGDVVKEIDITPYLPSNVEVIGNSVVKVTMKVEKLVTKDFMVSKNAITLTGMDEDAYKYLVLNGDAAFKVTVQGLADDLETLSASGLEFILNVSGYTPGTYLLAPEVLMDEGFVLISPKTISVTVEEKAKEPETEPDSVTEEETTAGNPSAGETGSTGSAESETAGGSARR